MAIVDVDEDVGNRRCSAIEEKQGTRPQLYTDMRKAFENDAVDIVSTATPNHWHALVSIWAIQAGKDVYVEKPVSHNVWEGRQIVRAARKHEKIVQTGTQSRSSDGVREGIESVRSGKLGAIKLARGLCYKRRKTLGLVNGEQPIPGSVDYDLWTGPAALEPLTRYKLHYDWHWVWNTGNGDIGNQGIHEMDMARWALGQPRLSPSIVSIGGRFGYQDNGETANTQVALHQYPEAPLIFEVRGLPEKSGSETLPNLKGARVGVIVECEDGSLVIQANQAVVHDANGVAVKTFGDRREA